MLARGHIRYIWGFSGCPVHMALLYIYSLVTPGGDGVERSVGRLFTCSVNCLFVCLFVRLFG